MATRILFASQKGGVGKSALARSLAVVLAGRDHDVLLADFDMDQLTCVEWHAVRVANEIEPDLEAAPFKSLKKLEKVEDRYDVVVLDTPGHADKVTVDVAQSCDVVFLPTGVSMDDLRPTVQLAENLVKKEVARRNIAVILSRTGKSERQEEDARDFIRLYQLEALEPTWPQKDGFVPVYRSGRVGREAPHPALKQAAEALDAAMLAFVRKRGKPELGRPAAIPGRPR